MKHALPLIAPDQPYLAYAYSYPHKSAYGPLRPVIPLEPLWQAEPRDSLFLYFHVPFCEMRCGFCNLFTRAGGDEPYVDAYLDAVERQSKALAQAAQPCQIARLAFGGGTPTYLSPRQLHRLFELAERYFAAAAIPTSVETSPGTATAARLAVLRERGVQRVSLGVQSFLDAESHAIGRPQRQDEVRAALERLRTFPVLNIDLIYGQPQQTVETWLDSVRTALSYQPEELYLYPLYVRPETGLGRRDGPSVVAPEQTRELYRAARELLLSEGYQQVSMRYFQARHQPALAAPVYCCQTDAMLGLGCGARSYTSALHYSSRFAVDHARVQAILSDWMAQSEADFGQATWGFRLGDDDRRRRFVLQSLLTQAGLDDEAFARRFAATPAESVPALTRLVAEGYAVHETQHWRLTPLGFEFSDAIGPALYSPALLPHLRRFAGV